MVGALRCFKLGGFEGTEVHTISDFIEWWDSTGKIRKHVKGKHIPLKTSSLRTEIESIWAVIQKEDTEHIDPYGYDVKIAALLKISENTVETFRKRLISKFGAKNAIDMVVKAVSQGWIKLD